MPFNKPSDMQSVNQQTYYTGYDARMWQGVQTITDYNGKHSRELNSDTSLPEELNNFEANHTETCISAPAVPADCVSTVSIADVSQTFNQVNIHKPAGPDGLPGSAKHDSNTVIGFAYDTAVESLITSNDKTAYREEVRDLAEW